MEELFRATVPPDEALVDLIEWAFLEGQIDGLKADLAYLWLRRRSSQWEAENRTGDLATKGNGSAYKSSFSKSAPPLPKNKKAGPAGTDLFISAIARTIHCEGIRAVFDPVAKGQSAPIGRRTFGVRGRFLF